MQPLPFNKPKDGNESNRSKSMLRGIETNYMPFPLPKMDTKVQLLDSTSFEKRSHLGGNESESIAHELDDLIKRFNNT